MSISPPLETNASDAASSGSDVYHVFAFEGFGGFPGRDAQPPRDYSSPSRLVAGVGSLSQLLNFWNPLVSRHPNMKWRYYAQNDWIAALNEILLLAGFTPAAAPETQPTGPVPSPPTPDSPTSERIPTMRLKPGDSLRPVRLVLLGYSYGGDAVHQLAHALLKRPELTGLPPELSSVLEIPLVFTVDPVKKWTTTTPASATDYGFVKPPGAKRWLNFYQRIDVDSMESPLFRIKQAIWGGAVSQADRDLEFHRDDFVGEMIYGGGIRLTNPSLFSRKAHIWIPAQDRVRAALHIELQDIANGAAAGDDATSEESAS